MLPFKHLKLGVLLSLSAVAVAVLAFAIRYFILAEYYPHLFQAADGGDKLEERAASKLSSDDSSDLFHSFHDEGYQDLWRYCNFLENIVIGDEAATSTEAALTKASGLKLSKVIVLIRHGARGPLRPNRSEKDRQVCDLSSVQAADYSLFGRLAEELVRNGASLRPLGERLRLPPEFLQLPSFGGAQSGDCQLARLTVLGLAQHIKLGYLLAGAYSARLGLGLKSWRERVAVASTEFSRTFQSAVALLFGLTTRLSSAEPSKNQEEEASQVSGQGLTAFPRHFNLSFGAHFCGPLESSEFCGAGPFGNQCPVLDKLRDLVLDQYDQDAEHVKPDQKSKKKPGAFERATWDLLSIGACHRKRTALPPDLIAHLAQRLSSVGRSLVESEHYQHSAWLKGYGFLREVIARAQEEEDESSLASSSRLLLYSGHDITIEPLKAILRLPDYSIPPYASRFIIEVFKSEEENSLPKATYLRLLYNGVDVTSYLTRLLPGEPPASNSSHLNLVELGRFEHFVQDTFERVTGTQDYETACKGEHLKP